MITDQDIIKIKIDKERCEIADERAEKKKNWHDTKEIRDSTKRKYNFLMGQLSEEAFRKYLIEHKKSFDYYDDIRKDEFKEEDKYDFILTFKDGTKKEANIKSSIFNKEYLTLNKGNLLAYPHQVKDINIQIFVENSENFKLSDEVYIFGWATEEEVLQAPISKLNPMKGGGATHNLPLKKIHPLKELFEQIV